MKSLTKEQVAATEPWIRNQNDEWAVDEGCWWDLERAAYHVFWVESNCALYEGVYAGEPLVLHSIAEQPDFEVPDEFYGPDGNAIPEVLEYYAQRFSWHNELRESGEFMHFHFECAARFYGWQRPSTRWAKRGIRRVRRFNTGAIWCAKKNSKALSLDTVLPTPAGWTSIGEVQSGDVLFDKYGEECRVVKLHDIHVPDKAYLIRFSNGQDVICNGDHLWDIESDSCPEGDVFTTADLSSRTESDTHWLNIHSGVKRLSGCIEDRVCVDSIVDAPPVNMRCISVDAPSGTFLFGRTMLPTHNSPILAKDILYITCADGEDGMKSFICAKDGKQAMIPWQHAYFMILQSEYLKPKEICTPNLTTKRIVYQPTNSWFEPLSSANSRVQDAKEGLNGSVFIDETHTVDREFMSIVEFAGASRVQPVHMMYSTAGKNPDSYGKEMWDYGESVVAGDVKDTRYFHQSYHAPQKLTVEEFDKDPEKYIRMANPSLGLTVDLDEIICGWERAKRKGKFDIIKFFLYRLNVWSNAADVWLAPGVWEACGSHVFEEEDLTEKPCVIGLDLARKFDMAAAVFAWTNDLGGVDLRPIFWCNEERIQQMATHCPKMLDWKDAGFVRVNEGNVTDFADVEKDLREEIAKWNVVGMVYDSTYAEGLIQRLQGGVAGPDGAMVFEPLNMGEQSMSQGPKTQTGPTTDFENQLKKKEIRHESQPVLDWQFSHANVKENGAGDIMVQKENRKSFKTVDGCQAAIMARWGLLDFEGFQTQVLNFYEIYEDGLEF